MRILFVSNVFDLYIRREALALMYLSAVLKKNGHETTVSPPELKILSESIESYKPDAVGFGTLTGTFDQYLNIAREVKSRFALMTIFGGVHPTFNPEIIDDEAIDAICLGEGEEAIVEFADKFDRGEDFWNTPNWTVKHNGEIFRSGPRPMIENLDTIPFPDRELFYDRDIGFANNPIKTFLAARGCPYRCSYCFNESFRKLYKGLGRAVRNRSPKNLVDEVCLVEKKYPFQLVWYLADTFILNKQWLSELAEEHPARTPLPYYANVRADLVDEEVVRLLKKGRCVSVAMGVEAGNPELRNQVLDRDLSNEQIINAAKLVREVGIRLLTFNIIALPGGSLEQDLETVDLNIRAGVDYPSVSFMIPFEKTKMYDIAKQRDLLPEGKINYEEGYYQKPVIRVPDPEQRVRLLWLFALAVEFPFVRRRLTKLLTWPLDPLYLFVYKLWKGYASKSRIYPHRIGLMKTIKSAFRYLTHLQR